MKKIIEEQFLDVINNKLFLDLLCYRNQKSAIMILRKLLGDAVFIRIMEELAGIYFKIPTAMAASNAVNDILLASLYKDMRAKSRKDAKAWNDAETRFIHIANRLRCTYPHAVVRAKKVIKEMITAEEWNRETKYFEQREGKDMEDPALL